MDRMRALLGLQDRIVHYGPYARAVHVMQTPAPALAPTLLSKVPPWFQLSYSGTGHCTLLFRSAAPVAEVVLILFIATIANAVTLRARRYIDTTVLACSSVHLMRRVDSGAPCAKTLPTLCMVWWSVRYRSMAISALPALS